MGVGVCVGVVVKGGGGGAAEFITREEQGRERGRGTLSNRDRDGT